MGFGFICNSIIGWILGWPGLDLWLVWGFDRQWLGWRFGWIADLAGLGWVAHWLGWSFGWVRDSVLLEVGDLAGLCIWFGWRYG